MRKEEGYRYEYDYYDSFESIFNEFGMDIQLHDIEAVIEAQMSEKYYEWSEP